MVLNFPKNIRRYAQITPFRPSVEPPMGSQKISKLLQTIVRGPMCYLRSMNSVQKLLKRPLDVKFLEIYEKMAKNGPISSLSTPLRAPMGPYKFSKLLQTIVRGPMCCLKSMNSVQKCITGCIDEDICKNSCFSYVFYCFLLFCIGKYP